jgi:peptidoglycan/LPS O-acetylase OafA/YrhL
VFLFFALSGFLIARMWLDPASARYARFAWRRTLRIYPAFLVAFAASLLFAYASGTWTPPDWPRVVGNLLFLNGAPASAVRRSTS